MSMITMLLIGTLTFGLCFLLDKGYTRIFRNRAQHRSGLAVRVNKRYASFGLVLCVLGIAGIFSGLAGNTVLLVGGIIVLLMAAGLIAYYMTFGVFYDEDSFILTTFGKKSITYRFRDIRGQQLYLIQGGSTVVELHLSDGNAVSIHSGMEGAYPFLDHAYSAWCRQTGRKPENCPFHDPANHLWFPPIEEVE